MRWVRSVGLPSTSGEKESIGGEHGSHLRSQEGVTSQTVQLISLLPTE
jgi:hypothetical protein